MGRGSGCVRCPEHAANGNPRDEILPLFSPQNSDYVEVRKFPAL